jgi:hypothetical protein
MNRGESGLTPLQAATFDGKLGKGDGRMVGTSLSIHGMHLAAVSGDKVKMTGYLAGELCSLIEITSSVFFSSEDCSFVSQLGHSSWKSGTGSVARL